MTFAKAIKILDLLDHNKTIASEVEDKFKNKMNMEE